MTLVRGRTGLHCCHTVAILTLYAVAVGAVGAGRVRDAIEPLMQGYVYVVHLALSVANTLITHFTETSNSKRARGVCRGPRKN